MMVHYFDHCLHCTKRIAELEAALSSAQASNRGLQRQRDEAETAADQEAEMIDWYHEKVKKAEAEVERLKKELKWAHRELNKVYPHLTFPDLIEGVNPSGDTLDRKERDDG